MQTSTIIFDLDGTLVDTKDLHHASFEYAVKTFDSSFRLNEELKVELEGLSSLNKIEILNSKGFNLDPVSIYNKKQEHTEKNLHQISWHPELPAILKMLSKHFTLCIASNARSKFVYSAINYMNISCFDIVITANFIPLNFRKPSPYIFIRTMEYACAHPKTTVIFEDSQVGIQAAHNANVSKVYHVKNSADTFINLEKFVQQL